MIPDDVVDRVREQADIVSVVGEFVKLKRVGTSFRGPCPFHHGKGDNFSISPRGGYKCFVCGESGDLFTFVQKQVGLDFVEAVKWVGAKVGVDVREVHRAREEKDSREPLFEVLAAAAEHFQRELWESQVAEPARQYLAQRALDRDIAELVGLGFASRDPIAARDHLRALGHDDARQLEAGLMVVREGETEARPRFRGRLMFPIHDVQGRVIAFGGRVIGAGEPKYLNSPETPVFQKGRTLYGLHRAKNAIRKDDRVLVVEGYFDAVRVAATGVESVVAPLGTALTEDQAKLMRRYTQNAYLLYDSDKAGLKATFRSGDELLRQGMRVLVVTLPEGEDPDTFARAHGREGIEAQLGVAIDVFERKVQILQRGGWFGDLRRTRAALDRLIPSIRATADALTRDLYLRRASDAAGIDRELLAREVASNSDGRSRELSRAPRSRDEAHGAPEGPPQGGRGRSERRQTLWRTSMAERELVRTLVHFPQYVDEVAERLGVEDFRNPSLRRIFGAILAAGTDSGPAAWAESLDQGALAELESLLAQQGGLEHPAEIVQSSVARLGLGRQITARLAEIDRELPLADGDQKDALIEEKQRLRRELGALGIVRYKAFDAKRS
jgi:DNA primase